MKLKKTLVMILLLSITIFMTGCWNSRELETLAIVAGLAIDKGSNGSGYHLTFETLDESGAGGGSGGGGQTSIQSQIIESNGNTLFDADRNALKISDKKLYFGDCKVIIISSQLADEGIAPILDWINRESETRLTLDIFISKENTAADVIEQKSPTNPITSYAIDKMDENDSDNLSRAPYMQLYKLDDTLGGDGESLYLPYLDIINNQNVETPELGGTAVFKKDKLLGFLGSEESEYLLFIKDQVNGGLLQVDENSALPNITLEIKKSQTNISTVLTGKTPKIMVDIKTDAALGEMETKTDYDSENGIQKLEKDADKTLEDNIKQLISKVQNEYDSDIFGFGNSIYQDDPYYWNEIKPKWDKLFKSLDVEVSADVEIKNTALTKSNAKVGD